MKNLWSPLVVLLGLVSSLVAKDLRSEEELHWYDKGSPGFDYDCTGKEDGNYEHPTTCTHYVACVNQTHAYEMACAKSDNNEQLHFVVGQHDPRLVPCDHPDNARCNVPTTTTTTTTTEKPIVSECNPNECKLEGYCSNYTICKPTGEGQGEWVTEYCGAGLFWNPDVNTIHGGVCDYWSNLNSDVQESYSCDPDCIQIECAWLQNPEDECSPNYSYRKTFDGVNTEDRVISLTCPQPGKNLLGAEALYWDQGSTTCNMCSRVKKHDGVSPCGCP